MTEHRLRARTRVHLAGAIGAAVVGAGALVAAAPAASAASGCSSIDIVFARGSGEAAGFGSLTGQPFVTSLTADLSGRSVSTYAVNYAADYFQTSAGAGSTDMTNHVVATAASCPSTKFVLGGYSQGATVVDKTLGIYAPEGGGNGTPLPSSVASKVVAIVVFGNPLGLQGQTIEKASSTYGARAKSFCNSGDPVCGGGFNVAAHLTYGTNGSTTQGAAFAAGRITG